VNLAGWQVWGESSACKGGKTEVKKKKRKRVIKNKEDSFTTFDKIPVER